MQKRILVVDDDHRVRAFLDDLLKGEGYEVIGARSGDEMRSIVHDRHFDLVILDRILENEDGLELARYIRERFDIGIIILTVKGDTMDLVVGLEVGADDYVAKPFNNLELLARIRSVLRRTSGGQNRTSNQRQTNNIELEGWRINLASQCIISADGDRTALSPSECHLLRVFVESPNRVISRSDLYMKVYETTAADDTRRIDVLVGRLRRKLNRVQGGDSLIRSVRGIGYVFSTQGELSLTEKH